MRTHVALPPRAGNLGNDVLVLGGRQGPWQDAAAALADEATHSIELWDATAQRWLLLPTELPPLLAELVTTTPY